MTSSLNDGTAENVKGFGYGSAPLRLRELYHPSTLGIGGIDAPWRPEEFSRLKLAQGDC